MAAQRMTLQRITMQKMTLQWIADQRMPMYGLQKAVCNRTFPAC
jgi:hypothetical protein